MSVSPATDLPKPTVSGLALNRLNSIDALRGLAALMVIVYHARAEFWVGFSQTWREHGLSATPEVWLGYATVPFKYGWLGVPIFFVLSGYCIHRRGAKMLQANPSGKLAWGPFFLRRMWRIYPVYLVALCLTAVIDVVVQNAFGVEAKAGQDNSLLAFVLSVFSLQGLWRPTFGSNTVFWTLSIEIHLYLVYPLMFAFSRWRGPMTALLVSLAISLGYAMANQLLGFGAWFAIDGGAGPLFLPYWFTWMVGFYLAEIEVGRARPWPWLKWVWLPLLLIGLGVGFGRVAFLEQPAVALAMMGLVAWSLSPRGARIWGGVFGRSLAWVGVFSYSLYAIHRPLFVAFKAAVGPERSDTIFLAMGAVVVAVGSAWLFFHAVERWSLRVPRVLMLMRGNRPTPQQ